jgi:hypothetical protein
VTEGFDPIDWLDIDEIPETDLFDEKHEDMGVGRSEGEVELDRWRFDGVLANSSSAGISTTRRSRDRQMEAQSLSYN